MGTYSEASLPLFRDVSVVMTLLIAVGGVMWCDAV
jgi:hypothetical protein